LHQKVSYIIEKLLERKCLKMSLHGPFEFLKHKLWPKKAPGIKLAI
jgi:hypothetical protein